jgi:hypothetical protein
LNQIIWHALNKKPGGIYRRGNQDGNRGIP